METMWSAAQLHIAVSTVRARATSRQMHTIENTAQIHATPQRILDALTTKEGIKGWWTIDVACDSEKKQATYRFPQKAGGAMEVTFQLLSADESGLVMKCV